MTDWKKILRDALKDTDGAYDKAIKALDDAGIKLQDVGSGDYVSTQKHNDEVTKLQAEIQSLKDAPNPLADELVKVKEAHTSEMNALKEKVQGIIKEHAISEKLGSLGITNELELVGLKSLIKSDEIKLDDNFNITDGLDNQIESLKDKYKGSFETKVVSTGQSVQTSMKSEVGKTYSSEQIDAMSVEEIMANLDAVNKSLK